MGRRRDMIEAQASHWLVRALSLSSSPHTLSTLLDFLFLFCDPAFAGFPSVSPLGAVSLGDSARACAGRRITRTGGGGGSGSVAYGRCAKTDERLGIIEGAHRSSSRARTGARAGGDKAPDAIRGNVFLVVGTILDYRGECIGNTSLGTSWGSVGGERSVYSG